MPMWLGGGFGLAVVGSEAGGVVSDVPPEPSTMTTTIDLALLRTIARSDPIYRVMVAHSTP